jgi:N6-adenosine-specific RNA methylase IME4
LGRILTQWPRRAYGTIIADPPWPLRGGKGGKAGYSKTMSADCHYPLMTVKQITELRVRDIALPDSHLYMWVIDQFLEDAFGVMRAWGFRFVRTRCWYMDDESYGLGQYYRTNHQIVMFGVRGQPPYARINGKRPCVDSAFPHSRMRHSQKPWDVHEGAELVSYGPRIELFARQQRKGWDSWGNELLQER